MEENLRLILKILHPPLCSKKPYKYIDKSSKRSFIILKNI